MTDPRYDVIAIGNAIVDVMAPCEEELIDELGLNKGGMTLVDEDGARRLRGKLPLHRPRKTCAWHPRHRSFEPRG